MWAVIIVLLLLLIYVYAWYSNKQNKELMESTPIWIPVYSNDQSASGLPLHGITKQKGYVEECPGEYPNDLENCEFSYCCPDVLKNNFELEMHQDTDMNILYNDRSSDNLMSCAKLCLDNPDCHGFVNYPGIDIADYAYKNRESKPDSGCKLFGEYGVEGSRRGVIGSNLFVRKF